MCNNCIKPILFGTAKAAYVKRYVIISTSKKSSAKPFNRELYKLMFHKLVSIILTLFFGSIFLGISDYFVGYQQAVSMDYDVYYHNKGAGFGYVYITAAWSIMLLFMPNYFVAKYNEWSPTSVGKLLPRGFFLFLGYISALLTFALLYMFE